MRNAGAVFARGLGGADFKVAVDGNRIATDDFAGKAVGERDGER